MIALEPNNLFVFVQRGALYQKLNEYQLALVDFDKAIQLKSDVAAVYSSRGIVKMILQRYGPAIQDFRRSIELQSDNASAYINLAWLLATCPEAAYRDGGKALTAAKRGCELLGWNDFRALDRLAAAYGELAKFDDAVHWQTQAIERAPAQFKDELSQRLELYRTDHPYRDSFGGQ